MFKPILVASVLLAVWPSQNSDEQWSPEVERAARTYRIQVYNSFRTNRPQFDRLQAVGAKALDAWKMEGRQPAQAQQVVDWFTKATSAASAGNASLPQVPEFVASWQPSTRRLVPQRPIAQDSSPVTQQTGHKVVEPNIEPRTVEAQPNANAPNENPEPSLVRGLGRALLRTVGVGGNSNVAGPDASRELPLPRNVTAATKASESEAPAPETESTPAASAVGTPQVDLDDLKARVDGFNPAISAVNQILQSDDPISTDQLAILAEELETLVQSYNDLQPYLALDSLSDSDRSYVGELVSPEDAVAQLRKHIEEASAGPELTPDSTDNGATSDELSRLDDLLRRVNKLELGPRS